MQRRAFLKQLSATAAIALSQVRVGHTASNVHWGYQGDIGPDHWSRLSDAFALCASGREQSPIDLKDRISTVLSDVAVDWRTAPLSVINNGHTIQVNTAPGSRLRLKGKEYELKQFHFHHPSEHTVNGNAHPMEVHFVHASEDGQLAVLGVFLAPGAQAGPAPATVQAIWDAMPRQTGERSTATTIAPAHLLPSDRSFYRYAGSLTTPPCSETVMWTVYADPVQVTPEQIKAFAALYPHNARPTQAQHRRFLLGNF